MQILRRPPVPLASLRRQVSPGESLIEFVLDAQQSYALQVTQEGLTVHPLAARAVIDRAVQQFLSAVKRKESSTGAAQELYRLILSAIVVGQTSSLIIVPDGSLHLVPFAALAKEDGALLNRHATITTAPSASTYFTLRTTQRKGTASRPFLGVAYTQSRPSPTQLASNVRGVFDLRGSDLKPIEYGREEVSLAANALGKGSITLYGANASEANLKSQSLRDFKVIHVAAHAVGNESEPDRAALILFPGNSGEDGLWQAREIRQLRLNADLVVLSACDTGTGRLAGEEGIMNLARSFLTAGSKSVVASLWSVDDRSTATLMESLYGHLAEGMQVREALRLAQLDFTKAFGEKAHPYYWAGFEVIGDGTRRITSETQKPELRSARTNF
jgi:CHAT domain-containing protein